MLCYYICTAVCLYVQGWYRRIERMDGVWCILTDRQEEVVFQSLDIVFSQKCHLVS